MDRANIQFPTMFSFLRIYKVYKYCSLFGLGLRTLSTHLMAVIIVQDLSDCWNFYWTFITSSDTTIMSQYFEIHNFPCMYLILCSIDRLLLSIYQILSQCKFSWLFKEDTYTCIAETFMLHYIMFLIRAQFTVHCCYIVSNSVMKYFVPLSNILISQSS